MNDYKPLTTAGIADVESIPASEPAATVSYEEVQYDESPPQQPVTGVPLFGILFYLVIIGLVIHHFYRKRHPKLERKKESPSPEALQAIQDGMIHPKSRVGFVLFAIFFGALGIHNFYALRIKSAVTQLLLTLFTSVALGALTGIAFAVKWAWWLENGWLVAAIVEPVVILGVWIWSIVEICVVSRDGRGVPMQ